MLTGGLMTCTRVTSQGKQSDRRDARPGDVQYSSKKKRFENTVKNPWRMDQIRWCDHELINLINLQLIRGRRDRQTEKRESK